MRAFRLSRRRPARGEPEGRRRGCAIPRANLYGSQIGLLIYLGGRVSYYNSLVEIHPSARKHGIADEDIEHAVTHAMTMDDQQDDTRLYLGPSRTADLLEVVTIVRADEEELAIHAMRMRPKYRPLLPEG
jgi:hypothetical protein